MSAEVRYKKWLRRCWFPSGTKPEDFVNLGYDQALWQGVDTHPAFRGLRDAVRRVGGDEDMARFYATKDLLTEIINAAGAIEYTVGKIEDLMAAAQGDSDEMWKNDAGPRPTHGRGVGTVQLDDISWEYGNLLSWVRALEDRVKRNTRDGDLGLLPAMSSAHPATAEVRNLWARFKSTNLLRDVRNQAALNLHAASLQGAAQIAEVEEDGRVVVRVPDPLTQWTATRHELTFEQGRDVLTFARSLLSAVEAFVDDLLDIFERNRGGVSKGA